MSEEDTQHYIDTVGATLDGFLENHLHMRSKDKGAAAIYLVGGQICSLLLEIYKQLEIANERKP